MFKKVLLGLTLSASIAMADYTIFDTKSISYTGGSEKEVFFGTLAQYSQVTEEIAKSIAEHGGMGAINGMSSAAQSFARGFLGEGLQSVTAGAGIGIIVGLMTPYIRELYADKYYVLIKAVNLGKGKRALHAFTLISDKHPELTEENIHSILRRGK